MGDESNVTKTEDKQPNDEKAKQALEKTATDSSKKKGLGFTAFLLLIVIILALVSAYNAMQIQKIKVSSQYLVSQHLIDNVTNKLNKQIDSHQKNFADIESRLDEANSRYDSLKSLVAKQTGQSQEINAEFALAEIEYLLTIANYRLQLNQDIKTAVVAIRTADHRLLGLDLPNVIKVREQLIADINNLESVNQADLSGLGLFLSDLIQRVDELPLKKDFFITAPDFEEPQRQVAETENKLNTFIELVWDELKSLVIISHDDNVKRAMLLPDQVYFFRANIKLELANARFAVFNRDTNNFIASVELMQSWLDSYFDKSDAAVKNILQAFHSMKQLDLSFPQVDISSSIESVRALSNQDVAE